MNMLRKHPRIFWTICALQLLVLLIMGVSAVSQARHPQMIIDDLEEWVSDFGSYEDEWYIDEELFDFDEEIDFLHGPYAETPKGTYTLKIAYDADFDQKFYVYSESGGESALRVGEDVNLYAKKNQVEFRFTVLKDVDDLEVVFLYDGQGAFHVNEITLTTNPLGTTRAMVTFAALFLLLDALLICRMTKEKFGVLLALGGITFLVSSPLWVNGLVRGHDVRFHMTRIESIAEGLRCGQFPVKMNWLYLYDYGYPVSIYYGDLFLYLPALLRLAGFTVVSAYKIFYVCMNAATVWIAYISFRGISRRKSAGLLCALAYVAVNFSLTDMYYRAGLGEAAARAFLPLIAWSVYRIYTEDPSNWKVYRKNALMLALGMCGLFATHTLTTLVVAFVLLIVCVLMLKKTVRFNTLRVYAWAVGLTVLISLHFLVPFFDYYLNVDVNVSAKLTGEIPKIQSLGASIKDYFRIWETLEDPVRLRLVYYTPGVILMAALAVGVILLVMRKASFAIGMTTVLSALLLFMASSAFPWDAWSRWSAIGKMLTQIQFPTRFLTPAVLSLTVLLALLLSRLQAVERKGWFRAAAVAITLAGSFICLFYAGTYSQHETAYRYYDTAQLRTASVGIGMEYIRVGGDFADTDRQLRTDQMEKAEILSRRGTRMELTVSSGVSGGTVDVPMFHYKGYHAYTEDGQELELTDGYNYVIRVNVPADYTGQITVDFIQPWYWRAAQVISLLSWIALSALALRGRRRFPMRDSEGNKGQNE